MLYLDYCISGTTRGETETGCLFFKNDTLNFVSDNCHSEGCYGNSYSSRDYLELKIARFLPNTSVDVIFYKITREIDYETGKLLGKELKISIPNHLVPKTNKILDFFDKNEQNVKYSENSVVKNFNIEEALLSKDEVCLKLKDYCDLDIEEFFMNS